MQKAGHLTGFFIARFITCYPQIRSPIDFLSQA